MPHFGCSLEEGYLKIRKAFTRTLPQANEKYTVREPQIQMATLVFDNFAGGKHLLVEAGTGTGKSNGYLVPILVGIDPDLNNVPVVIATATKVLQDQLARELPRLLADLGIWNVRFCILKGKGNYLCPYKYEKAYSEGKIPDFLYRLCREKREVDELGLPPDKSEVIRFVNADDDCLGRSCPYAARCPLLAARWKARNSHLIVTNHHVVMYDMRFPNANILPAYKHIVFDEGHEMPEILASVYTRSISHRALKETLKETRNFMDYVDSLDKRFVLGVLDEIERLADKLFASVKPKRFMQREPDREEDISFLIDKDAYDGETADELADMCLLVARTNGTERLVEYFPDDDPEYKDDIATARRLTNRFISLGEDLKFIGKMHRHFAFWAEEKVPKKGKEKPYLIIHYTPVDVGPLYQNKFGEKSVVITSATLGMGGKASYFQSLLGFDPKEHEDNFVHFPSPFDYDENMCVYVPEDMPSPGSEKYFARVCEEVLRLIGITQGRTLVLCTSKSSMNRLYEYVSPRVPYKCLVQREGAMKEVVPEFVSDEHSVLFGTKSLWEGLDVPGASLSSVILDKLPFPNQSNPIVQATCEYLEANFKNPFKAYTVPEAVMQFKQGIGRLIRSEKDFGIVAILDSRMLHAAYGEYFMDAIPTKNIVHDVEELESWWKRKTRQQ